MGKGKISSKCKKRQDLYLTRDSCLPCLAEPCSFYVQRDRTGGCDTDQWLQSLLVYTS